MRGLGSQESVIGLDLSIRNTGVCCVPAGWDHTMGSLFLTSFGAERDGAALGNPHTLAKLEIERYLKISKGVVDFVKKHDVKHVAVERYAFSVKGSSSVTKLAELGGIVKSQLLLSCRVPGVPVSVGTARKHLTGGIKKGRPKEQVERFLKEVGLRFDNMDEMDAFVIAYYWYCQVNEIKNPFLRQQEFVL